jgi:microcystin degradation protein MlrC
VSSIALQSNPGLASIKKNLPSTFMKRIGIAALLHESNTFLSTPTTESHFRADLWLEGSAMVEKLSSTQHELGGFFQQLIPEQQAGRVALVPLVALRATPAGAIHAATWELLEETLLKAIRKSPKLDGLLLAAHGAAVSQEYPDADGRWLSLMRNHVGADTPIVTTIDPHANLSKTMVDAVDALIAYRTNPHLDQKDRGIEAAKLLLRSLDHQIQPKMAAAFPAMAIPIDRQGTDEPHWKAVQELAASQRSMDRVLSNSLILGFPYADVAEMGSATLAVTDGDQPLAQKLADELADSLWQHRNGFRSQLVSIEQAMDEANCHPKHRFCLLDMGDNVGGGSAGDGTYLIGPVISRAKHPTFACLYDPEAVDRCRDKGDGGVIALSVGGKTDRLHGPKLNVEVTIQSLHDGRFEETQIRHGGIRNFDQGPSAVVRCNNSKVTLLLTSKRIVPFSLQQLRSCGLDPSSFQTLVAKGVHAPLAAYREVCDRSIRVNTPGSTCADIKELDLGHRRRPLFPIELPNHWQSE